MQNFTLTKNPYQHIIIYKLTIMQEKSAERAFATEVPLPGPLRIAKKPSLRQMAVERVRAAIENGHLKADARVTELGLAAEMGVAQATVREALVELESQGFVERRDSHRYITALSRHDVEDIYIVRERLEVLAVELLSKAAHPDLREAWQECHHMHQAAQSEDRVKLYDADLAFHRALWRATGNRSLLDVLERLVPKLFAFGIIRNTHMSPQELLRTAEMHRKLLELIGTRDTEAAIALARESMAEAWTDDAKDLR